jgi:hypothetical protein
LAVMRQVAEVQRVVQAEVWSARPAGCRSMDTISSP